MQQLLRTAQQEKLVLRNAHPLSSEGAIWGFQGERVQRSVPKRPLAWQYITVALGRKSLQVLLHEYSTHAQEPREPGQKWFFKYQHRHSVAPQSYLLNRFQGPVQTVRGCRCITHLQRVAPCLCFVVLSEPRPPSWPH